MYNTYLVLYACFHSTAMLLLATELLRAERNQRCMYEREEVHMRKAKSHRCVLFKKTRSFCARPSPALLFNGGNSAGTNIVSCEQTRTESSFQTHEYLSRT